MSETQPSEQPNAGLGLTIVIAATVSISASNVLTPMVYALGVNTETLLLLRLACFLVLCSVWIRLLGISLRIGRRNTLHCIGSGFAYTIGSGKSRRTRRQTVAVMHRRSGRLTPFQLRPEGLFEKIVQSLGGQDIDFVDRPGFSRRYVLQGDDEAAIRALLTDEVINGYLVHVETGEPIPASLVAKIKNAATFNQGFSTTEYLASALMDMRYHMMDPTGLDPDAFERETLASLNMPKEMPRL